MKPNIYLIGMMGSGKSTVGRRLAMELKREFVDCDREIEMRCGLDIAMIFEAEGESGFRQHEQQVLTDVCKRRGLVVATGGGAVLTESNRALLRASGFVVYLNTSLAVILQRVMRNRERPLLNALASGQTVQQKLAQLIEEREPLYRDIADVVVLSNKRNATELARVIAGLLPSEVHTAKRTESASEK